MVLIWLLPIWCIILTLVELLLELRVGKVWQVDTITTWHEQIHVLDWEVCLHLQLCTVQLLLQLLLVHLRVLLDTTLKHQLT